MTMTSTNTSANATLREQLQSWAETFGHTQDPYLIGLDAALEKSFDLEFWQSIDALAYLPNYNALRSTGIQRAARVLAGIRNIIIFVPVALTWAAVSEATKAFNEFVLQNTGTPANFLQFWQDGYGLLDKFWSIGSIAQLDFVIVALVIVLTAMVAIMQSQAQSNQLRENKLFTTSRIALALQIKAFLYDFKPINNGSVSTEVTKAVKSLRTSLANGASIEKPYARLSKNISAAATEVKSSTTSLKSNISALQREIAKAEKKLGK